MTLSSAIRDTTVTDEAVRSRHDVVTGTAYSSCDMPNPPAIPARALLLLALAGCGSSEEPTPDNATDQLCRSVAPLTLAAGTYAILDPARDSGCVVLPSGSGAAAEYVAAVYSASGLVVSSGIRGQVSVLSGRAPAVPALRSGDTLGLDAGERFHDRLRAREAALAARPRRAAPPPAPRFAMPPVPGDQREFLVCADLDCATFERIGARAAFVGENIAVFIDTLAPAPGLSAAEVSELGALMDTQLYPLDTTAFGQPSDIDGNGRVIALLTPAVNRLAGGCNTSGFRVLGYFNGADLLPGESGSNAAEVFFALVPDPANTACTITHEFAMTQLPVTFVHELQHMISYHQHVLLRAGPAEATWLNEGLSHLAEELAGRQLPDPPGAPPRTRLNQFAFTDVDNAYGYLLRPESYHLVTPGLSTGSSGERGANWLFVRWLVDHYGTAGQLLSRRLVETSLTGSVSVEDATGQAFAALLAEWHLANVLGDSVTAGRLGYRTWDFRGTYGRLHRQDPGRFPRPYPLVPETVGGGELARVVTLRGGSGWPFRYAAAAGARPLHLRVTGEGGGDLPGLAEARVVVLRVR